MISRPLACGGGDDRRAEAMGSTALCFRKNAEKSTRPAVGGIVVQKHHDLADAQAGFGMVSDHDRSTGAPGRAPWRLECGRLLAYSNEVTVIRPVARRAR